MVLNLNIVMVTNKDYDEVDETVKEATPDINGVRLKETYTYETTVADATIQTEIETDLTAKGYTW